MELGARFIETDLRLTRDSHLVAMHDETLDRTTSGRGRVDKHTLAELRALDAGSWFAPEFAGERIPTLEEILAFSLEHDIGLYLELKPGGIWRSEHALVGALRGSAVADRLVVLCFDAQILKAIYDLEPSWMTGLLEQHQAAGLVERALGVGARQVAPHWALVSRELVQQAHAAGLMVVPWTVNEPEPMRTLIALGVDGIITDYPDRLVALLRAR